MVDSLFNDSSMQVTKLALDGLARRQDVISRNIANVDTPGYRAQNLSFEAALKKALRKEDGFRLEVTSPLHLASPTNSPTFKLAARPGGSSRADGNNVDIDVELTNMSETGIEYQALSQAASKKLQLLKTIAMSR